MDPDPHVAAGNVNLHAPWRIEYIRGIDEKDEGCFLCRARDQTDRDADNLLLWRTVNCLAVLNRYPYSAGHLLIAPAEHLATLEETPAPVMAEMMELVRDATVLLGRSVNAQGLNVGINLGRCAGAGLPGHLHVHVVPRWSGDTNFMSALADVRVVNQSLAELWAQLRADAAELGLPRTVKKQTTE